jgi:glycosidase
MLYSFADNHDVNRVASQLNDLTDLFNLYTILYTMPGIPSIYYGSEWGIQGEKTNNSDQPLRPDVDLDTLIQQALQPELPAHLANLARIRQSDPAIQSGGYRQIQVTSQQFAFLREKEGDKILVAVNSEGTDIAVSLPVQPIGAGRWVDLLNPGIIWEASGDSTPLILPAKWGRILKFQL